MQSPQLPYMDLNKKLKIGIEKHSWFMYNLDDIGRKNLSGFFKQKQNFTR